MATDQNEDIDAMADELADGLSGDFQPLDNDGKGPLDKGATPNVTASPDASAADGKSAPAPTSPEGDTKAPAAAVAPVASNETAPSAWRREIQPLFANLPPEVKAEILRRESDIGRYVGQVGPYAKVGEATQNFFSNQAQFCRENNLNPWDVTADLWNRFRGYKTASAENKIHMLVALAAEDGIQLNLQGATGVHPAFQAMQDRVNQITRSHNDMMRQLQTERMGGLEKNVESFAADPANVYFADVAPMIAELLNRGMATTLKEAYDKACQTKPRSFAKDLRRAGR